jgi:signal transduction histidine kinase
MPKRSSKPGDLNQLAAAILAEATDESTEPATLERAKDPAAVSLGRRGGLKGGKARAESLSREERTRIAQEAARKRWGPPKADVVE